MYRNNIRFEDLRTPVPAAPEARWAAMTCQSRVGHLRMLSSNGLAGRATAGCRRARAARGLALGLALADTRNYTYRTDDGGL